MPNDNEVTVVGRANAWDLRTATTGTKQIRVRFKIEEGEYVNKNAYWTGSFTEKTYERTLESMRNCGWQGDDLLELDSLGNKQVQLVVFEDEYEDQNGELKSRLVVNWVNKMGTMAVKGSMSADERKKFAAQMRGKILATGQPKAPEKTAEQVVSDMDDIPF